jgi:hypothetical protein
MRFSPDGMYYWDGATWISTLSPDGRFRWNGSTWVPVAWAPAAPYSPPQATQRRPTSWTRPLQYAVAGWYAISALATLSIPFWMGSQMNQIMRAAIERQQQQNPDLTPPPPSFYDAMNSMMNGLLWVIAVFAFAIAVVVIVGALQRWTWLYYAVVVLLGLSVVSGPADLLNLVAGTYSTTFGYSPPAWLYVIGFISWFPSTALFVVMLVALVKRGPWGMVKVSGGGSPAA